MNPSLPTASIPVESHLYFGDIATQSQKTIFALSGIWHLLTNEDPSTTEVWAIHQDFKVQENKVKGPKPHRVGKAKSITNADIDSGNFGLTGEALSREEVQTMLKSANHGLDLPPIATFPSACFINCQEGRYPVLIYVNQALQAVAIKTILLKN